MLIRTGGRPPNSSYRGSGCESLRIGLNLLQARPGIGGGWQYIAGLLDILGRLDKENEYVAYCNRHSELLVPAGETIRVSVANRLGANQLERIVYENSWLPHQARVDRLDLMHWFGNTQGILSRVPSVITIHDLRSFENIGEYSPARMLHARVMIPWSVRRARLLFPVSKATAAALHDRFQIETDRIFVIPYPVGSQWRRASPEMADDLRTKYDLPHRFWLYVAQAYPHKNHRTLFAAYAQLRRSAQGTWPLVLRGDDKPGVPTLAALSNEFGIANSVIRLPPLPDNEMPLLYSAATALIFPSKYEGIGMPLIEALACGCPAIASAIPTTYELAGDNVITCDPSSIVSISDAMARFQQDAGLLAEYSLKASDCAKAFSPDTVLQSLMNGYNAAVASRV